MINLLRKILQLRYFLILLCIIFNNYIYQEDLAILKPMVVRAHIYRIVRGGAKLTPEQERLKEILDKRNAKIEDIKLIVGAKLDPLLEIDERYAQFYEKKAKDLVMKVYEEVDSGDISRLPTGIWEGRQGKFNGRILIHYVIEKKESWQVDRELPLKVSQKWFKKVGLGGMLQHAFSNSPLKAIKFAYPEHFWDPDNWDKPFLWFDHEFDKGVKWSSPESDHYTKQIIRYMIEWKEKWTIDKTLPKKISGDWFKSVGLDSMLLSKFGGFPLKAIKFAYPEHFWDPDNWDKPFLWFDHDFSQGIRWSSPESDHYAKQIIRYMIERKEDWKIDKELPQKVSTNWFAEVGLIQMLKLKFNGSPILAIKFVYPEYFWDPDNWDKPFLWFDHDFSQGIRWSSPESDHYAKQIIRYMIERKEKWQVDKILPKKISQDWFKSIGLASMLMNKFSGSPLKAIKFAYPEHFWDPDNWDKPFLWFDHEFDKGVKWSSPESSHYAKQIIRYMIEWKEKWTIDKTLSRKATAAWFYEIGLASMLEQKFNASPLEAIKFAYPDKFEDGTLSESDFPYLRPGRGPALVTQPPIMIPKENGYSKSIDGVLYYFGSAYKGYYVAKLSNEYGVLLNPDKIIVNVFPLFDSADIEYVNVPQRGLLWPVSDNLDPFFYLKQEHPEEFAISDEKARQILLENYGIDPFTLSLREQYTLTNVLNREGLDKFDQFFQKTGYDGVKVLANVGNYKIALRLVDAFSGWRYTFKNYAEIARLSEGIARMYGRNALRYRDGSVDLPSPEYTNYQMLLEFGIKETLREANNRIMELLDQFSTDTDKITKIIEAQDELYLLIKFLDTFRQGLTPTSSRSLGYGVKEIHYDFPYDGRTYKVRLITRPKEVKSGRFQGEACIRFTIQLGAFQSMGFRVDRSYDDALGKYVVTVDIDSPALNRAYSLGGYEERHHYQLAGSHQEILADQDIFAWLVRTFY